MNYKNLFYVTIFFLSIAYIFTSFTLENESAVKINQYQEELKIQNSLPCIEVYDAIMKYSKEYKIPKKYAFGIAYLETGYQGPFHWKYNHLQTSSAGAMGPMQIMPTVGDYVWEGNKEYSRKKLREDIDFNILTSMKILRRLYDIYGDWKIALGYYNTGRPCVNSYAERIYNHEINWKI